VLSLCCKRLLSCSFLLFSSPCWAASAEQPIYGGLGLTFGDALSPDDYGAEIEVIPESNLPANRSIKLPLFEPGATLPWRQFNAINLPRPLRKSPTESFVMLNHALEPMRVISRTDIKDCKDFDWMKTTLTKKYNVQGDAEIEAESPYKHALRIEFLNKQIDVRCGPVMVIDYLDASLIERWSSVQQRRYAVHLREEAAIDKRRLVLKRRTSIKFADSFTIGDQFRLEGAFGVQFQRPFAKNSTQKFPVDQPFYAVLPDLPAPFDQGEIQLVISPDKFPIVIRGTFHDLTFEQVGQALKAKYGTPLKASNRHIIHKVSGNHAIVKKLSEQTIELAFIDTGAQTQQRQRLWEKESEGL
jgi:hypothetical protein